MASTFKNYTAQFVGTSANAVYNPTTSNIQSTIIGMTIANIGTTSGVDITTEDGNVLTTEAGGGTVTSATNGLGLYNSETIQVGFLKEGLVS